MKKYYVVVDHGDECIACTTNIFGTVALVIRHASSCKITISEFD